MATNSVGRMRHAAGEDLPDDRAHPLLADPHPRRDLGDRNAAVEVVDDQLFPLEFPGAAAARGSVDGGEGATGGAASRQADKAAFSFARIMNKRRTHFRAYGKKLLHFLLADEGEAGLIPLERQQLL